jgi:hypothetical protein
MLPFGSENTCEGKKLKIGSFRVWVGVKLSSDDIEETATSSKPQHQEEEEISGANMSGTGVGHQASKFIIGRSVSSQICGVRWGKNLSDVANWAFRKYCNITYINYADLPRPIRLDRWIASITQSQFWNFFETRQDDLFRFLHALRLPDICRLRNGSVMAGEEIMVRGLHTSMLKERSRAREAA